MIGMKSAMTRAAMSGLYHSGAHRLLAPYTQGAGVIFTLNQVRPPQDKDFAPNRGLEVAPGFLEAMLDQVEEAGLDVVTLDEAARRLREDDERRFVCFTFDQAYRDIAPPRLSLVPAALAAAHPLYRHRLCLRLGRALVARARGGRRAAQARSSFAAKAACGVSRRQRAEEKQRGFEQIYEWLRSVDEARQRQVIRALADSYDIDMSAPATN